jgi:hypothetical protein
MYLCYNLRSLKERQQRQKREVNGEQEGVSKKFAAFVSIIRNGTKIKEESESNWC